jgi:hypothetical protein
MGTGLPVQLITMSAAAEFLQAHGLRADLGRQDFCPGQGAVGDDHALDACGGEVPRGQGDHFPGADHQRRVLAQVREHAPREAHRRGCHRYGIGADLGFGAHPLGGGKRRLEQLVERRTRAARFLRHAIGVLQLTENLRLAQDHRIQSRGDVESVFDRALGLVDVQARGQIEIIAVMPLEPLRQLRSAGGSRPVHLGAIAGGKDDHLSDAGFLLQRAQCRLQPLLGECHFFAQCERCGLVIDTEDAEWH